MKKLTRLTLLIMVIMAMVSCQEEREMPTGAGAVVFKGTHLSKGTTNLKSNEELKADYARIIIDQEEYICRVFYLKDKPYTESIKLSPGIYTVESFEFYDDSQTPDDTTDDVLLYGTPVAGSEYAEYVTKPVKFEFEIVAFMKTEVDVEVLRFEANEYEDFGFSWFAVNESVIREQCFFGDICVKNPSDYEGSAYSNQENGLQIDMPAIAQIKLYQESDALEGNGFQLMKIFDNESSFGEGAPLCIQYEDHIGVVDKYQVEISILVRSGSGFEYKHFYTWKFMDDEMIEDPSDDGVIDYVLGACYPNADYIFAPYMNLPETCTYKVTSYAPGHEGAYLDAYLTDIGPGFELSNGLYPSWCFDHATDIHVNTEYAMDIYSSLYPEEMPPFARDNNWEQANWLMNHLDWYPGYDWQDLQGALWLLEGWDGSSTGGLGTCTSRAVQMAADAQNHSSGYVPPTGGWAAVVFISQNSGGNTPYIQTVFVMVDP